MLLIISFVTPYFFDWFINKRFAEGAKYVFWVGLGYVFWGGYMLFSTYIFYFKRNRILAWLAVLNVIINVIFNYCFIKWFGAIGAAYSTALSFLIVFIIVAIQSNKLIKLPWFDFKKAMLVKIKM